MKSSGIHGLSCRHSAERIRRHNMVNDIVWRAMQKAKIVAAGDHQVYFEVKTSVQTVSRLHRGSKVNEIVLKFT